MIVISLEMSDEPYFMHSCFQPSFCFLLASFRSIFLDIALYACKKYNENKLNIKQKY